MATAAKNQANKKLEKPAPLVVGYGGRNDML